MPLYHCSKCHHEWEGTKTMDKCDWCKSPGYILEDKTPLEEMLEAMRADLFKEGKDDK